MPHARPLSPDLPWDYIARARELVANATSLVDIGTGGGERLSTICQGYHGRGIATEEWEVNAPVAANALRPLGFGVVHCADERLPFRDGAFDLILNRHSSLDPLDVPRLLAPGG